MNGLHRFFILLTVTFTAAGCAAPIGTIGGSGTNADTLWAVPNRQIYGLNEPFLRRADLQVFASYGGVVEQISVDAVTISVTEDPYGEPDVSVPVPAWEQGQYLFIHPGRNIINITYGNDSTHYSIEVQDPSGVGGNNNGNGGGGTGVTIVWGP